MIEKVYDSFFWHWTALVIGFSQVVYKMPPTEAIFLNNLVANLFSHISIVYLLLKLEKLKSDLKIWNKMEFNVNEVKISLATKVI